MSFYSVVLIACLGAWVVAVFVVCVSVAHGIDELRRRMKRREWVAEMVDLDISRLVQRISDLERERVNR